jgi:hypothetical protein
MGQNGQGFRYTHLLGTQKEAADRGGRHICTVAGQVPGGLFDIDDDRLMFSAFKMAHTRSATQVQIQRNPGYTLSASGRSANHR